MPVRPMLLHGPSFLSTVLKKFGQLARIFGQMDYRPPWQKIARTPMIHSRDSFIHVSVILHISMYVYLQLPLDDITSVALECIVRGTLAELSKFSANLKSFDFFVIAK